MGYAVFHATKGSGNGNKLGAHINRDASQSQTFRAADPSRTHLNIEIKTPYSDMKLEKGIDARIKDGYTGKKAIRKDAVKFMPMVMTGSHKEMLEIFKDEAKSDLWIKKNIQFAAKEFGKDNIVKATLHMDEKTPHLHIVVVPLTEDGRLSAKEMFGGVLQLSERQDRYADAMKEFGLERGIKGAKAVHTSEGWYIAKQRDAAKVFLDPLANLNVFQRMNPYKKVEALTEGFKLALNHKVDSDFKANSEQSKSSYLSKVNANLESRITEIIGSEQIFKNEQNLRVEKMQASIHFDVERRIKSNRNLKSVDDGKEWVKDLILEKAKEQKGISQELYNKIMVPKFENLFSKLIEEKVLQNLSIGKNLGNGFGMGF